MSVYWLFFASLTVLGGLTYNVGMKFGTQEMNVFTFVFFAAAAVLAVQSICFLIAKYGFHVDVAQGLSWRNAKFAIMAGAALIDIAYFLALRYGSMASSQIFWAVGGMIMIALVSTLVFKEPITLSKALGILFGIVAVVLISK